MEGTKLKDPKSETPRKPSTKKKRKAGEIAEAIVDLAQTQKESSETLANALTQLSKSGDDDALGDRMTKLEDKMDKLLDYITKQSS